MKLDVDRLIGAVRREFVRREYNGKPALSVIAHRTYDTTADDLWNAITTRDRICRWLGVIEGELVLGGRYQIQGNASGQITTCEPPRHLALTWEFAGSVSWVEVTLAPDGKRTHLVLEHIGPDVPDEHFEKYGPGAGGVGWELGLVGLAHHLETGESAPSEAEPTPELKQLIRLAAAEWGRAAIAGGVPEDQARAQAARTAAFYTGDGG
jgi:uncharacterized protein YndB with AHSA1/START domain